MVGGFFRPAGAPGAARIDVGLAAPSWGAGTTIGSGTGAGAGAVATSSCKALKLRFLRMFAVPRAGEAMIVLAGSLGDDETKEMWEALPSNESDCLIPKGCRNVQGVDGKRLASKLGKVTVKIAD